MKTLPINDTWLTDSPEGLTYRFQQIRIFPDGFSDGKLRMVFDGVLEDADGAAQQHAQYYLSLRDDRADTVAELLTKLLRGLSASEIAQALGDRMKESSK
jgi:hypothetical protein